MRTIFAIALLLALTSPNAFGAYNAYLRIEGIDGESEAEGREGWIDIESVSHGVAHLDHSRVTVLKRVDAATPLLARHCAAGAVIPEATIDFVRQDQTSVRFYRVVLKNVLVAQVEEEGAVDAEGIPERVALGFNYIEWGYTEFDVANQPIEEHIAYWDLLSQTGGIISGPGESGAFRMRAELRINAEDAASGVLTWRGLPGKTYEIYYAPTLLHDFNTLVGTVPSSGDVITSFPVDFSGPRGFFIVKEID